MVSLKSLSPTQATGNKDFSKLTSPAAGQPLSPRKLCWAKFESMPPTEQEESHVRFSESIYKKIPSKEDYTTEELKACWYTAEEKSRIYDHCRIEIRNMNEGSKLKGEKYFSRGLEGHTTGGAALKQENILLAVDAVLDEQMIQWKGGFCDEDAIAAVYYAASSSSQVSANIVGLADYADACSKRRTSGRVLASRAA
jgi:hypothetical protein